MKFLPSIYHGCSTRKMFWEEKFTGKKYLFQYVIMKNCGRRKVSKHKDIKVSDKIVNLNVSAKFDSLNNMETTSSESKGKLGRSGKGLVTTLVFKTKVRSQKYKKARSFSLTFPMAYLAFFFRPCFGIESQSGYQPLS